MPLLLEGKNVELKREYTEGIKNTVIAFANCDGGIIYIGVSDDGSVCGVDDADGTMLRVASAIRDAVFPDVTMFVEYKIETIDGKSVVVVAVQRGTSRPYYLRSKGVCPEGVYVRHGSATVPASEAAILNMIKETSGDSYEAARSIAQRLTFESARAIFKHRNVALETSQMRTLCMIGDDGAYTNLAFLLSDMCTHSIKIALFEGKKKAVFKDRKEITGSLLSQIEEAYDYINRSNRTRAEFRGLDRIDIRDYPTEAVRETLLNAVVHRDYSFSAPVLISIFDDRMEFVSVGGLVKGISLEDINLGVSALRNPNLANVFYRLRLIEAYGTGIMKINECYSDSEKKPKLEAAPNAFKVTLPNLNFEEQDSIPSTAIPVSNAAQPKSKREEEISLIADLCRKNGYVTRKDLENALGISQSSAGLLLRGLTSEGLLIKSGAARNTRYFLKQDSPVLPPAE